MNEQKSSLVLNRGAFFRKGETNRYFVFNLRLHNLFEQITARLSDG